MWISNCRQFRNNISPRRVVSTRRLRRERAATRICLLQILWVLNQLQSFQICDGLLVDPTALDGITSLNSNSDNGSINSGTVISSSSSIGGGGRLWDKFDNMERSVGAVLIKVAYGTTSTTKRSIPDNSYVPSLTTVATPPLTTLRYLEKTQNHQQINLHHRNYELDLERDHALPTSAPNADILKSNSNPTYPNPNRHRNHDRDRHRHVLNSTPAPSIHNLLKKGPPTIPMFSGDMPSYSPPLRSFFTPPLPPEYQNPFADKPTLRGTSNDAGVVNTGTYINRRPIPPPSLMPGQERIPLRPPDLNTSNGNSSPISPSGGGGGGNQHSFAENGNPRGNSIIQQILNNNNGQLLTGSGLTGGINTSSSSKVEDGQRKKALNTPSQKSNNKMDAGTSYDKNVGQQPSSSSSSHPGGGIVSGNIGNGVNSATSTNNETSSNTGRLHLPSISRILSSSNGRKEDIPEVLLRTVTARPTHHPPSSPVKQSPNDGKNPNINKNKNNDDGGGGGGGGGGSGLTGNIDGNKNHLNGANNNNNNNNNDNQNTNDADDGTISSEEDDFDMFVDSNNDQEEPKTQPKIKMSTKSTETPANDENSIYSTQIIHNLANINNEKSLLTTSTPGGGHHSGGTGQGGSGGIGGSGASSGTNSKDSSADSSAKHGVATWTVAWNIHVYLSAILFTILAVYSIFKMIFYDKLTHLFNQSYFICIHLILIIICMSRIFYLCYDAYNIHSSFHLFVSEILLNLPATFLTISFSVLILFLLIRSLNHKNNRYSALIRPLTVVVGSSVHVGLCITLHYVESYTANHSHQAHYYQQQQQLYRNAGGYRGGASTVAGGGGGGVGSGSGSGTGYNNHQMPPPPPPRVLSLICQIIYIFVCLSLGLLYLYIYRILKRVLRSKSQNYIHGYQNLSYAIHITIATALLYVLLAALQIYGAISISTTRPLITSSSEIDWLQWGYQFSLRLIEIAIITLMSWVAGLKTGGNSGVLQREKAADTHNVSGFALFPCTSSSSQEHFETDYPAVCNANTNLHTYTLRTGKPIYDDNFALNSLAGGGGGNTVGGAGSGAASGQVNPINQQRLTPLNNEFQIQNSNDFVRSYETSSLRSAGGGGNNHHHHHHHHHHHQTSAPSSQIMDGHQDFITDPQTDHYENPNFELRSTKQDNCYSEPLNSHAHHMVAGGGGGGGGGPNVGGYDFQNFERPVFGSGAGGGMMNGVNGGCERPSSRGELQHSSKLNNKSMKSMTSNHLDRSNYENPERRSSNSTHSCTSGRHHPSYNSFERRSGVRKSGTLSNIGGIVHGRNGSSSSSSSSSRPSGVQTLSSAHNRNPPGLCNAQNTATGRMVCVGSSGGGGGGVGVGGPVGGGNATCTTGKPFYRDRNHRSSLERSSSAAMQQYIMPSDDEIPERANLIKSAVNGSGSAITSSTSGNLTDGCMQQLQHQQQPQHTHQVASSSSGDSATSGSMLVAEHGFVRFRALDDMNNAQGVGIHNASIRTNGRNKEKRFTNNT